MAAERTLYAKENHRLRQRAETSVDIPFLVLVLLLLAVGLTMLYSASYAQVNTIPDTLLLPGICKSRRCVPDWALCAWRYSAGFLPKSGIGWPGRCMGSASFCCCQFW